MHLFPKPVCLGHETHASFASPEGPRPWAKPTSAQAFTRDIQASVFPSLTGALQKKLVIHLAANTSNTD